METTKTTKAFFTNAVNKPVVIDVDYDAIISIDKFWNDVDEETVFRCVIKQHILWNEFHENCACGQIPIKRVAKENDDGVYSISYTDFSLDKPVYVRDEQVDKNELVYVKFYDIEIWQEKIDMVKRIIAEYGTK